MDFTDDERNLLLAGLLELTITYLEDTEKIGRCTALADGLGGDRDALFFGASLERVRSATRPRPKPGPVPLLPAAISTDQKSSSSCLSTSSEPAFAKPRLRM
jgi:hypothetical protein